MEDQVETQGLVRVGSKEELEDNWESTTKVVIVGMDQMDSQDKDQDQRIMGFFKQEIIIKED